MEKGSSKNAGTPCADEVYALRFVWGLWGILVVGVLTYISVFGYDIPFLDEFDLIDVYTGNQKVDLAWLWSQHNEHRIPLPRLVHLGLAWLTHYDFRAGMYFNAVALAFLAAVMVLTVRRIRGHTSYADAFFPLALLNYGHCENLLWSFQVEFVLSTLMACGLLLFVIRSDQPPNRRSVVIVGLCLLGLPLTGAHGIPIVPPLAAWLIAWTWRFRQAGNGGALLASAVMVGVASTLLVAFYFFGYNPCVHHPRADQFAVIYRVARQFLAMAGGIGVIPFWGIARYTAVVVLVFAAIALARRWWAFPNDRPRCLGLLSFLFAMVGLAFIVGWGRGGMGPDMGFGFRYVTLSAPWILAVYMVTQICRSPRWTEAIQMTLAIMVALLFVQNTKHGLMHAMKCRERFEAVADDLAANRSAQEIAVKHSFLYPLPDRLAEGLERLRRANIGPWRQMGATPVETFAKIE